MTIKHEWPVKYGQLATWSVEEGTSKLYVGARSVPCPLAAVNRIVALASEVARLSALVPRWVDDEEAAKLNDSGQWYSETARVLPDGSFLFLMRPRALPPLPGTEP